MRCLRWGFGHYGCKYTNGISDIARIHCVCIIVVALVVILTIHGREMGCDLCSKIIELQCVVILSISDCLSIVESLVVGKPLRARTSGFRHVVAFVHGTTVGHDGKESGRRGAITVVVSCCCASFLCSSIM
jgi:hypothetical protein